MFECVPDDEVYAICAGNRIDLYGLTQSYSTSK
jgi:hypothetical protein